MSERAACRGFRLRVAAEEAVRRRRAEVLRLALTREGRLVQVRAVVVARLIVRLPAPDNLAGIRVKRSALLGWRALLFV
jgi:hypothetical protein